MTFDAIGCSAVSPLIMRARLVYLDASGATLKPECLVAVHLQFVLARKFPLITLDALLTAAYDRAASR